MDAIVYTRRRPRVTCMAWFLFFSFRACPRYGADGQQCSKVHLIALANVIKRCSQTPIPGPGYPLVVLAPARAVAVGYRCYPSRGGEIAFYYYCCYFIVYRLMAYLF